MRTSTVLTLCTILIFAVVVGTPLFYLKASVYPYTLPKTAFFEGTVKLLVVLWLALAIVDPRFRPKKTPLAVGLGVFFGVLVATSLLGVNPSRSFWSTQERAFGVVTLLHMGAFSLALSSLSSHIPWRRLFAASVGTAGVISILAFIQLKVPTLLLHETVGDRPGATFGNPTFLAGYLVFHVFVALYLFFPEKEGAVIKRASSGDDAKSKWGHRKTNGFAISKLVAAPGRIFLFALLLIILAALFRAQTRGDILGLAAGVFTLLALFAERPPAVSTSFVGKRWFYAGILALAALSAAGFWLTRSSPLWASIPGLRRFQDISLESKGLEPRFIALRAAWRGFRERPLTGWGWDNFNVVFNKYYDPKALAISYQETRFDKPHNAILELLVVGGAPLFLSFFGLIGALIVSARRAGNYPLRCLVVAAAVSYIVRNAFVFDTIGPFLVFAVFIGHVDGIYRAARVSGTSLVHDTGEPHKAKRMPQKFRIPGAVAGGAIAAGVLAAYFINWRTIQASRFQFLAFQAFIKKQPLAAIQYFKRGSGMWSPYQLNFLRDYATAVAEAHFYNKGLIPLDEVWAAVKTMEEVARKEPLDAYNHYSLVDLYNQVSDLDPAVLLPRAEAEAKAALTLSPDRQEVYFSLSKTKYLKGDKEEALRLLRYALDLNPEVPDAHFYYGLMLYSAGDDERGYRELKEATRLGRRWKSHYEPRVVANFFADSGHLDEAIALYETSLAMRPEAETKAKLGVAYFLVGDRERARAFLAEAVREVDLRTSPAYENLRPILEELGVPVSSP